MNDLKKDLKECRHMLESGASVEAVISELRIRGMSKVHSIKALVDLGVSDLAVAKQLVHDSIAWTDLRDRDDEFHRTLGRN